MDKAQRGHTMEFNGLQGASHLNGTRGTLVQWLKKEQRWSVRYELDNKVVKAKPEKLLLQRIRNPNRPIIGGDCTPAQAARLFGAGGSMGHGERVSTSVTAMPPGRGLPGAGRPTSPSSWAKGLSQEDQYEWLSNYYQMRCDDDYEWGGCNLHGPYDPEATPESIAEYFLVFCVLAHHSKAIPKEWDWLAFLQKAAQHVAFAFEKSDAKERWGSENFF